MDINRILVELRDERQRIENAIAVLERLGSDHSRRRPPKWMKGRNTADENSSDPTTKAKSRKRFSEEARKRMAQAQRNRWANKRAAAAGQS